jgi:organic radical activating enzyme
MSKIKVSELFYSIQGEGRYTGVPSVFLRTFGCNFTCDGFGMSRGEKSLERIQVAFAHGNTPYKDYKELPLVSTGCDSYASWMPAFKELSPVLITDAIVNRIMEILPYKRWHDEHLVITGGEPLLGWQRSYPELLDEDSMIALRHLTFETNGTQKLTKEFKQYLVNWSDRLCKQREVTFSVSAKLPVSGEKWEEAILPEVVCDYEKVGYTYLKFVIASEEDLLDARQAVKEYREHGFKGPVYLMPVGGVERVYNLNNRRVAEMAMREGWRYSDRLQVPLFKNEWGT